MWREILSKTAVTRFGLRLISLLVLNDLLAHRLLNATLFIRIHKLVEFYVVLKWHLLCVIQSIWGFLEIEKRPHLLMLRLNLFWSLFVRRVDLESSVSWALPSFGHGWLNLFLLQRIYLFVDCLLVLLLLTLRIRLLLLLLMAHLPGMLQLISINLLILLI